MSRSHLVRSSLTAGLLLAVAAIAFAGRPQQQEPPQQPPAGGGGVSDAARWDKVFSEKAPHYRTEPNEFLARVLTRLSEEKWLEPKGKKAIDLAMGDGRNALLLAQHGFATTGIDISTV